MADGLGEQYFGKAGLQYNIIKGGDPNFGESPLVKDAQAGGERQGYGIGPEFTPTYAMPSGPGFPAGDPAGGGKRRRRGVRGVRGTRTFPRGILRKTSKVMPSRNPSKSPPTRKRSILIVSEKKVKDARKSAKAKASKTDIGTIRKRLVEKKIISSEKKNIPPAILRTLYIDAVGAGLLS